MFDSETGDFIASFGETAEVLSLPYGLAFHPGSGHLFVSVIGPRVPDP